MVPLSAGEERQIVQFFVAIVFFHGSEYGLAVNIHGKSNVTLASLLISTQYVLATIFAIFEYIAELFLFPKVKEQWLLSNIGLVMVLIGEVTRKVGILTARRAFTHTIRIYHEEEHELVTHGIYRSIRHPGYCGFFIWAVGMQLMVCNVISAVAFTAVLWHFFSKRIPYPFSVLLSPIAI